VPGLDSPMHWLILALVFIVLFGYKKLPDASRSIGRSMRIFKAETKGLREDSADPASAPQTQQVTAAQPIAAPAPVAVTAPVTAPAPVAAPAFQPEPMRAQPPTAPVIIPPGATAPPVPAPDARS
jgi:sec-independent protein translocase protein TatA